MSSVPIEFPFTIIHYYVRICNVLSSYLVFTTTPDALYLDTECLGSVPGMPTLLAAK